MPCDAATLIANAACLECGIPQGMTGAVMISLLCQKANRSPDFTSSLITLDSSTLNYAVTHTLGVVPSVVRCVAVCQGTTFHGAQSGYTVGTELDLFDWTSESLSLVSNSTQIRINLSVALAGGDVYAVTSGAGGSQVTMNATDIKLKVYAWK